MVVVRWHGHACFEIVSSSGLVIVIDPHDGSSLGLKPPRVQADLVLITHEHFDHNAYSVVAKPSAQVFSMKEGFTEVAGIKIWGFKAYHDTVQGRRRGSVVMYKLIVDDIAFLHAGDLGHELSEEQASQIKPVDIAMLPVGGTFTIDSESAWKVVEVLQPRVVIPMHYWIKGLNLPLRPVDDFLAKAPPEWKIVKLEGNEWTVTKDSLPEKAIVVFSYT